MRILRTLIVPMVGVIGLLPLLGGCDYDEHHEHDHERRAYPAGYYYGRDGYYYDHDRGWDHDRDWDHDHWRDRDGWRHD